MKPGALDVKDTEVLRMISTLSQKNDAFSFAAPLRIKARLTTGTYRGNIA